MSELPERRPRVLVAGTVLGQPMGGVRRHNAELLPRAARLLEEGGGGLAVLEGRVPPAFPLPPPIARLPSDVPAAAGIARAWRETRALARALADARERGTPFSLVHTAHFPAPRSLEVPFVLTVHDLRRLTRELASPLGRRAAARVIGAGVRRAACTIAVSEVVRAELAERFDPRHTALVPNAADHLPILPRAPTPDAPLLHVGHLEPRKNLELLLRALALDPSLPHLLLAGRAKDREDERLLARAAALGVRERVHLLGPVDDDRLARLYARCACVVLPSRLEGFGIPALEAQRAGAPLAVAELPALVEVAGEDTPRFSPDDPAACVAALRAALARDETALRRAQRRARDFTWDASARALVRAWCEAAG